MSEIPTEAKKKGGRKSRQREKSQSLTRESTATATRDESDSVIVMHRQASGEQQSSSWQDTSTPSDSSGSKKGSRKHKPSRVREPSPSKRNRFFKKLSTERLALQKSFEEKNFEESSTKRQTVDMSSAIEAVATTSRAKVSDEEDTLDKIRKFIATPTIVDSETNRDAGSSESSIQDVTDTWLPLEERVLRSKIECEIDLTKDSSGEPSQDMDDKVLKETEDQDIAAAVAGIQAEQEKHVGVSMSDVYKDLDIVRPEDNEEETWQAIDAILPPDPKLESQPLEMCSVAVVQPHPFSQVTGDRSDADLQVDSADIETVPASSSEDPEEGEPFDGLIILEDSDHGSGSVPLNIVDESSAPEADNEERPEEPVEVVGSNSNPASMDSAEVSPPPNNDEGDITINLAKEGGSGNDDGETSGLEIEGKENAPSTETSEAQPAQAPSIESSEAEPIQAASIETSDAQPVQAASIETSDAQPVQAPLINPSTESTDDQPMQAPPTDLSIESSEALPLQAPLIKPSTETLEAQPVQVSSCDPSTESPEAQPVQAPTKDPSPLMEDISVGDTSDVEEALDDEPPSLKRRKVE